MLILQFIIVINTVWTCNVFDILCWLPFHFISCAGFELRVRGPNTCAFSLSHLFCLFIYLCRSSMFVFFIKKYLLGNYANVIWLGRGHSAFISPLIFIIKSIQILFSFFFCIAFLHCFFISSSYLLKMSDYLYITFITFVI